MCPGSPVRPALPYKIANVPEPSYAVVRSIRRPMLRPPAPHHLCAGAHSSIGCNGAYPHCGLARATQFP